MAVPNLTGVLKQKEQERDSMSRHQSQASRRRLMQENEEAKEQQEAPPVMYTEKSQTLLGEAGDDGCEELKVEEEKNDFFDYQFHPVP